MYLSKAAREISAIYVVEGCERDRCLGRTFLLMLEDWSNPENNDFKEYETFVE